MRSILTRFKPNRITTTSLLNSNKMGAFSAKMLSNANNMNNNNNSSNEKEKKTKKEKLVIIMGPTGSGKSRLSIDIARHIPSEIINSDKIQLYKGLDITTNKIPFHQRHNIPHHLLGEIDSSTLPLLSPSQFRFRASSVISSIHSRRNLPLLVGGSNSYIYALLATHYDPTSNVFGSGHGRPNPVISADLRYECCFLWVDIDETVLNEYLVKRVDEMIDSGMVDELSEFYESEIDEIEPNAGLRKAIGVPEFERYFRRQGSTDLVRYGAYQQAVQNVKDNTCRLAKAQLAKIQRLKNAGWDLHRLDGTDSFQAVLDGSNSWADIWKKHVVEPSIKIVNNFLEDRSIVGRQDAGARAKEPRKVVGRRQSRTSSGGAAGATEQGQRRVVGNSPRRWRMWPVGLGWRCVGSGMEKGTCEGGFWIDSSVLAEKCVFFLFFFFFFFKPDFFFFFENRGTAVPPCHLIDPPMLRIVL